MEKLETWVKGEIEKTKKDLQEMQGDDRFTEEDHAKSVGRLDAYQSVLSKIWKWGRYERITVVCY